MGFNTDDLEVASTFELFEGEANFPPTITREVVGGAHIAPHCITVNEREYILIDWVEGLPRHDSPGARAIRFPHGLMKFGESFEDCAQRLVSDQLGMKVVQMDVIYVYSYVDDASHWHLEPLMLTYVDGVSRLPANAKEVRHPVGPSLPAGAAWRGKPPFEDAYRKYIEKYISS
jgi:8-oxo-dGTP pyrophosphatase MutT (NUDIX family)